MVLTFATPYNPLQNDNIEFLQMSCVRDHLRVNNVYPIFFYKNLIFYDVEAHHFKTST